MVSCTRITDIDDPRVSAYRSLKVRHPGGSGTFIVESRPAVRKLLRTDLEPVSCLTTEKSYEAFREEAPGLDRKNVPVYLMEKSAIEDVIGFRFHLGIMMEVRSPLRVSAGNTADSWRSPHLLVALNGVHDPQNVGLIARNAAAFGADALIADADTFEPFYRKVARISMGSIFDLNVAYEPDLAECLSRLRGKYGTKIVVTSPEDSCIDLAKADLSGNVCIVLGNEAAGASKEIIDLADMKVRIPIFYERADSLNVACTSAVFLHEAGKVR